MVQGFPLIFTLNTLLSAKCTSTSTHGNLKREPHPPTVKQAKAPPLKCKGASSNAENSFTAPFQGRTLLINQHTSFISFLCFFSLLQSGLFRYGNVRIQKLGAFDEGQAPLAELRGSDSSFFQRRRHLRAQSIFQGSRRTEAAPGRCGEKAPPSPLREGDRGKRSPGPPRGAGTRGDPGPLANPPRSWAPPADGGLHSPVGARRAAWLPRPPPPHARRAPTALRPARQLRAAILPQHAAAPLAGRPRRRPPIGCGGRRG